MKIKYYTLLTIIFLSTFCSCSDNLNTNPTDQISGNVIFKDVEGGMVAMNGVYRMMYSSGWAGDNSTHAFRYMSTMLVSGVMGDDMIVSSSVKGWFSMDYNLQERNFYSSTLYRPYSEWNFYYTLISNLNYIIAHENDLYGLPADKANLFGQAYALRAMCYFHLIQLYQQTYKGHEQSLGVPVYTTPTTSSTPGKPRGTVENVYMQINNDIEYGIELLKQAEDGGITQKHKSHIDYYIANGIKSRIALVQERWQDAVDAAVLALKKPDLKTANASELVGGFNDINMSSVLWGAEIQKSDQIGAYASFFCHMDAMAGMHGSYDRKCISAWLYKQMGLQDLRRVNWWKGSIAPALESTQGAQKSYCTMKFRFSDYSSYLGDNIYMRAEELLLTEAEALCHLKKYKEARSIMETFGTIREKSYVRNRLDKVIDDNSLTLDVYGTGTTPEIKTLLDEILLQRRIELWGETGRLFDILRLKTGYYRGYEGSNHVVKLNDDTRLPDYKGFILTIPQTEFDGNINMDPIADQNPL